MRFQIIKVMLFQLCRNPVPLTRHLARFKILFWILHFLEGPRMKKRICLRPVLRSCMPRARDDDIHILLVSLQRENNFAVRFYALKKIIHTVTALQNISILILYMLLAMTTVQNKNASLNQYLWEGVKFPNHSFPS